MPILQRFTITISEAEDGSTTFGKPAVSGRSAGTSDHREAADTLDAGLMHVDPAQVQAFVATRPVQLEQVSDAPVPLASAWAADRAAAARGNGAQPVGAVGGDAAQSGWFVGHTDGDHAIDSRFVVFREKDSDFEHVAVIVGNPDFNGKEPVRVRLHSSCLTGDLFGSLRCDCGDQLRGTVQRLAKDGGGIVLYLSQEGRGIGIANKLRAYRRQDAGLDTLDANQIPPSIANPKEIAMPIFLNLSIKTPLFQQVKQKSLGAL